LEHINHVCYPNLAKNQRCNDTEKRATSQARLLFIMQFINNFYKKIALHPLNVCIDFKLTTIKPSKNKHLQVISASRFKMKAKIKSIKLINSSCLDDKKWLMTKTIAPL